MTPKKSARRSSGNRSIGGILRSGRHIFTKRNKSLKPKTAQGSEPTTSNGTFVSTKEDAITVTTNNTRVADGQNTEPNFAWVD